MALYTTMHVIASFRHVNDNFPHRLRQRAQPGLLNLAPLPLNKHFQGVRIVMFEKLVVACFCNDPISHLHSWRGTAILSFCLVSYNLSFTIVSPCSIFDSSTLCLLSLFLFPSSALSQQLLHPAQPVGRFCSCFFFTSRNQLSLWFKAPQFRIDIDHFLVIFKF